MTQPVNVTVVQRNQGCGCLGGCVTILLISAFVFSGSASWLSGNLAGLAIAGGVGLVVFLLASAATKK